MAVKNLFGRIKKYLKSIFKKTERAKRCLLIFSKKLKRQVKRRMKAEIKIFLRGKKRIEKKFQRKLKTVGKILSKRQTEIAKTLRKKYAFGRIIIEKTGGVFRRNLKPVFSKELLSLAMVFSFVFNQAFYPALIAQKVRAQEADLQTVSQESGDGDQEDGQGEEDTAGSEDQTGSDETSQEGDDQSKQEDEPEWEGERSLSCGENEKWDEGTRECVLDEDKQECNEGECPEISQEEEACVADCPGEVGIVNENEAEIKNEISADSDTGNNTILSSEETAENDDQPADNCLDGGGEGEVSNETGGETTQETSCLDISGEFCGTDRRENQNGEEEIVENEGEGGEENQENGDLEENGEEDAVAGEEQQTEDDGEAAVSGEVIETGEAQANAAVINEINKNAVGDNWIELVLNIYGLQTGDINLLEYLEKILQTVDLSNVASLDVENINQAEIENVVSSEANTGENVIEGTSGENAGAIETGKATANSQVVNIINQNLVGNNWIFIVINILGQLEGDVVVPGEGLAQFPGSEEFSGIEVKNENDAEIKNEVIATSNTGENSIGDGGESAAGGGKIETGDAQSQSSVINVANTNIVNNNWFQLIINNAGFWLGSVLGWIGEDGETGLYAYDFQTDQETAAGDVKVYNKNSASVVNLLTANANTGNNRIDQDSGDTVIKTGDASAFGSVINFVNTNIVGNNWMFVAVNVLGLWNGNAVFAYPDLEISIDDGQTKVKNGDHLDYSIIFKNNGKAKAENITVKVSVQENGGENEKDYLWSFGKLQPGEEEKISLPYEVESSQGVVRAVAGVISMTKETYLENNQSADTTEIYYEKGDSSDNKDGFDEGEEFEDSLKVKRTKMDDRQFGAGEIISHAITVENTGDGMLYDVEVKDRISFSGNKIMDYIWPIGDMEPGVKLMVQYQLLVNPTSALGVYQYTAFAEGDDYEDDEIRSNKSSTFVQLVGGGNYGSEVIDDGNPFEVISTAQAFDETMPAVLGALKSCGQLPFWMWMAAFIAYVLAINWSFFQIGGVEYSERFKKIRFYGVPVAATLAVVGFSAAFWCSSLAPWLLFFSFLSFLAQLSWKNRGILKNKISRAT